MKRYIKSSLEQDAFNIIHKTSTNPKEIARAQSVKKQERKQHFIIWFKEGDDEDYTIISAKNITEARDRAEQMFGEAVESVQFYNP